MRPACPTCGGEGDSYVGTARGAQLHYFRRVIWGLHQMRVAADRDGVGQLSQYASAIIRDLEDVFERLFEDRTH